MSRDMDTSTLTKPEWSEILAILEANPERLRHDLRLLDKLGLMVKSKHLIDFGPASLARLEARAMQNLNAKHDIESTARAHYDAQTQTHELVLNLMDSRNLSDLAGRFEREVQARFGLAAGRLCLEDYGPVPGGWMALDDGGVEFILGEGADHLLGEEAVRPVIFGGETPDILSAALIPIHLDGGERPGLVAFGSVGRFGFTPEMGIELIAFIARMVEKVANRWPLLR